MLALLRRMKSSGWLLVPLAALALTACGGSPTPIAVYVTPTLPPTETQAPPPDTTRLVMASRPLAAQAITPLRRLLQVSPTPTPGTFGPIITVPPQPATSTPTPAPVIVSTSTPTPAVTATPTQTATLTRTPEPTPIGTPLPTYRADMMGIQIDPYLSDEDFATMLWLAERLGIRWVKFQFVWARLEPEQGVYSELFYRYRIYIQRANSEGFNVMVSVVGAPDWARVTTGEEGPPRDPQTLAAFLTTLLNEVRVDLYGRSYIDAIEVWNEPNLSREWNGGTISGAEYMRLFDAAYRGIRAGEGGQSIIILTAGLAPTGINDGVMAVDDRLFLRQMYQAGLNNPAYQNVGIGIHPYGAWNPPDARCCLNSDRGFDDHPTWFFLDTIEDYRAIMLEYGDEARQMWATEFGWASFDGLLNSAGEPATPPTDPPYIGYLDRWQMANYIMRAFEIGQNTPYMGPMMLWNLNFGSVTYIDAGDPRPGYSILSNTADPLRPAFTLIETAPKQ